MADEELKKAFSELQAKKQETSQLVSVAEGQIQTLKRSIAHSRLTCKELESLPPATPLYHTVGRMFLLASHEGVRASLAREEREAEKKIKEIEANMSYWERAVKEQEDSLRELVSHRQRDK